VADISVSMGGDASPKALETSSAGATEGLVRKIFRCAGNLSPQRFEMFRRIYVLGEDPSLVMAALGMTAQVFDSERRAIIRALMH